MGTESEAGEGRRVFEVGSNLASAFAELLSQEFEFSSGHLTAVLNTCLFAPSILTFWFVNGVVDFSTAVVLGSVGSTAGLLVRLYAYLLVVPTFLLLRASFHLAHPVHRQEVLSGSCPSTRHLSLDWFTVGILATGLPLALQDLGPWLGMNAVFLVGLFVAPRPLSRRAGTRVKFLAILVGSGLFAYAKYGGLLTTLPAPAATVGPVATLSLTEATTASLMAVVNSLLVGPVVVAAFGVLMNRLLTRPELTDVPYVRHTLPRRDPDRVVVVSAALGTVFYLLVVAAATGSLVVVP
ncbi:hypothetical protein [Natronomonas marina]|jgi:hypothetical protein|uniref:hypothetical protein n=1 Tax=Natronomonas marina TaxID=2961939 RepID=UPI0020C99E1A|nr:hypothetical protein [Natronomonas marina]